MVTTHKAGLADAVGKLAMRVFLGLLVVNAVIAIAAILGATGDSDWAVVGTTLLLTAGCLTIAANAAAVERGRLMPLPVVGAALACLAYGVFILLIWMSPESDDEFVLKASFIALTLGLAATYVSVLAIPDLLGVFATARSVGMAAAAVIALLTVGVILAEGGVSGQIFAALSVVVATATIIVLTGALIESRKSRPQRVADLDSAAAMHCPSCAAVLGPHVMSGEHHCQTCGLGFRLQVTSPRGA